MTNKLEEAGISWVIIGSQTKPYRPPPIEAMQEIVEAADKVGIPVFLKNNLNALFTQYEYGTKDIPLWAYADDGVSLRQEMPK